MFFFSIASTIGISICTDEAVQESLCMIEVMVIIVEGFFNASYTLKYSSIFRELSSDASNTYLI